MLHTPRRTKPFSKLHILNSTLSIDELKDIQGTFMENLFEIKKKYWFKDEIGMRTGN